MFAIRTHVADIFITDEQNAHSIGNSGEPEAGLRGTKNFTIFTARIRRMREGTVFSLFVSSHLDWGGGCTQPFQLRGTGILPDNGGTPILSDTGYPHVAMVGTPGSPHQDWVRVCPCSDWMGYFLVGIRWGTSIRTG